MKMIPIILEECWSHANRSPTMNGENLATICLGGFRTQGGDWKSRGVWIVGGIKGWNLWTTRFLPSVFTEFWLHNSKEIFVVLEIIHNVVVISYLVTSMISLFTLYSLWWNLGVLTPLIRECHCPIFLSLQD